MKIVKANNVYNCCGQLLVPLNTYKGEVVCPRCEQVLKTPVKYPVVRLVQK